MAQPRKSSEHFFLTSGSERSAVAQNLKRSNNGSSMKVRWKRDPAFWISPSIKVKARSCRCALPYFSFLRIALAASAGPEAWSLMASTSSGMPLKSSSS